MIVNVKNVLIFVFIIINCMPLGENILLIVKVI